MEGAENHENRGKPVAETCVVVAVQMNPSDANPAGNIHGGVIMKLIDTAAGVVATRHARMNVVTASIDRLDFYCPVFVGDLLTLKASVNYVGRTSMEIGVRIEAENLVKGLVRHTASAYLTYVALTPEGKPAPIEPLLLETAEDRRRNSQAIERQKNRTMLRKRENRNHPGCNC